METPGFSDGIRWTRTYCVTRVRPCRGLHRSGHPCPFPFCFGERRRVSVKHRGVDPRVPVLDTGCEVNKEGFVSCMWFTDLIDHQLIRPLGVTRLTHVPLLSFYFTRFPGSPPTSGIYIRRSLSRAFLDVRVPTPTPPTGSFGGDRGETGWTPHGSPKQI